MFSQASHNSKWLAILRSASQYDYGVERKPIWYSHQYLMALLGNIRVGNFLGEFLGVKQVEIYWIAWGKFYAN